MNYSLMFIYKCKMCGDRVMRTKVYDNPGVHLAHETIRIVTTGDVYEQPLFLLHDCAKETEKERVRGLCEFIGFTMKEAP